VRALLCCLSLAWGVVVAEEDGWIDLLEGDALEAWMAVDEGRPGEGWVLEDGVLHRSAKAGDLVSRREFVDFELEFEWKVTEGANSGVKYRLRKTPRGWLGPEYQVIDDAGHKDAKAANRRAAALYDLVSADEGKPLKPAGEWNRARVVVAGARIEHWLNGERVLAVEVGDAAWAEALAASKFARVGEFATPGPGRLMIQDHGDEVWFRGLRVRPAAP